MQKFHQIIWEKWQDPFGEDEDINDFLEDEDEYQSYDDDSNTLNQINFHGIKKIKVISTPMGIIPINENTASGKIFNFWTGHSNFNITKAIINIIDHTDGVESLDVFTRYRFRIGIGKAFNDSEVMQEIQQSVYNHLEDNNHDDE